MKTLLIFLGALMGFSAVGQDAVIFARRKTADSVPVSTIDTFNRTSSNPMSTAASDGISTWVDGPGSSDSCQVKSNQLAFVSGDGGAMISSPTYSANQWAEVVCGVHAVQYGPCVRIKSLTDMDCYWLYIANSTTLQLYAVDDNGAMNYPAAIGGNIGLGSPVVEGMVIRLEVSGSTFTIKTNGVAVTTRTDSTYSTGQPGLILFNDSTGFGDVDTFNAGVLP